jgi:hypothetical protein
MNKTLKYTLIGIVAAPLVVASVAGLGLATAVIVVSLINILPTWGFAMLAVAAFGGICGFMIARDTNGKY